MIYVNADQGKSTMCADNKNKCGVYRWISKINGKSYVGSSVSLSNKFSTYYSLNSLIKVKGSIIIYRALLKYGYSNFSVDILEYCERNTLMEREQYYINILKPEYNIKVIR
jgi:group I intron endonuclease